MMKKNRIKSQKHLWTGVCKCGHENHLHKKISNPNYTHGKCGFTGCDCKNFIHQNNVKTMSNKMQYSPKLKKAIGEIKSILEKHDIAGFVVIHTPGYAEFINKVNPSYSCALIRDGRLGVKLKTEDLPGGKEQAKQIAEDTYNMVTLMADAIAVHAGGYIDLHRMLKDRWNGEEGPISFTSHQQQNN